MSQLVRVLVVGVGNMGLSHAKAYHTLAGFEIVGLVSRNILQNHHLPSCLDGIPRFACYEEALMQSQPDAVSICSYTDTHAPFSIMALEAGAHVFVEKPLALTLEEANAVVKASQRAKKQVVVGYILHHHPSWQKLVAIGKQLGKPLVMRMNLNQQSSGATWETHKNLMKFQSPLVDCGVHYVDIMCQLTNSRPSQVQAIGVRLSEEIATDMYNYGQLQVKFEDGSVGWYEAGWGPMMSEVAFFVKDVVGPQGSVSLVVHEETAEMKSDNIDAHTKTNALLHHQGALDANNHFLHKDFLHDMQDEPTHQELCEREQTFFLKAIQENLDLTEHLQKAVDSLQIVLGADESIRTGAVIRF